MTIRLFGEGDKRELRQTSTTGGLERWSGTTGSSTITTPPRGAVIEHCQSTVQLVYEGLDRVFIRGICQGKSLLGRLAGIGVVTL